MKKNNSNFKFCRKVISVYIFYIVAGLGITFSSPALAFSYVALHQWYNEDRGDSRLTSDPSWGGSRGETKEGYRWVGIVGNAVTPHLQSHQVLPDTIPLHTWYNPNTRDHVTSTENKWQPSSPTSARPSGYRYVRLEGYIYHGAMAGTVPLYKYWSRRKNEQHTTSAVLPKDFYVNPGRPRFDMSSYGPASRQGYVITPSRFQSVNGHRTRLGVGNAMYKGRNGVVRGAAKIMVVAKDYQDVRLRHSLEQLNSLIFDTPNHNVKSYFEEISGGKFSLVSGGMVGPLRFEDDRSTSANEAMYNCTAWANPEREPAKIAALRRLCPGYQPYEGGRTYAKAVFRKDIAQIDRQVDFRQFDNNQDGKIDSSELVVAIFRAAPNIATVDRSRFPAGRSGGGIARYMGHYGGCIPVDGIEYCAPVVDLGEGVNLMTIAHEVFHAIGTSVSGNDIYPGNSAASLMAATISNFEDDQKTYHLDAWHKMRVGWVEPHIKVIGRGVPPSSMTLKAPDIRSRNSAYAPIIFFNPVRGTREMFLAEARLRKGYDSGTSDTGVAVWYAKVNSNNHVYNLNPFRITKENYSGSPRTWKDSDGGLSLWTIGFKDNSKSNAIEQRRGGHWTFLNPNYGDRALNWYHENPRVGQPVTFGPSSGLSLRAARKTVNSIDLIWTPDSNLPFKPRIHRLRSTGTANRLALEGDFGSVSDKKLWMKSVSGGSPQQISIRNFESSRLMFDIPENLTPGRYHIYLTSDVAGRVRGNRFPYIYTDDGGDLI